VERVTRPAALALAATLQEAGLPVVLVTAGGDCTVHILDQPASRLALLTERTSKPVRLNRAFSLARTLQAQLNQGRNDAVVVLLTHAWFGAEDDVSPLPGLRGLFVQYPNQATHPPWARRCERWAAVSAQNPKGIETILGRLAG
jgi:hypothetical protein